MSEGSVPPLRRIGLSFYPKSLLRRVLGRIRPVKSAGRAGDSEARERAATALREHARSHATLFERLERLGARSERLEREGIPSDSATNRTLRAESEVHASLMDLRSYFVVSGGDVGAFDLESKRLYPGFEAAENS